MPPHAALAEIGSIRFNMNFAPSLAARGNNITRLRSSHVNEPNAWKL